MQLIADEVLADQIIETFNDGATTPSVAGDQTFYKTANTAPTTLSDLLDGRSGQVVTIVFGDANTTVDFTGTNLIGNGGVDFVAELNEQMRCLYDGTNWFCDVPVDGGGGGGPDEFVNGVSFNVGTGDLTLTREIGVDLTQNLDGRYLLSTLGLPAGTIERQILVWDDGGAQWNASINLDLPDSGYMRLRNSTSEFAQFSLDDNDKVRIEGNLETVLDFNTSVSWEDSTATSDIRLLELTDDPNSVVTGNPVETVIVRQSSNPFTTTIRSYQDVPTMVLTSSELTIGNDYMILIHGKCAAGHNVAAQAFARIIYQDLEYPGTDFRNDSRIGIDTSGTNGDHFGTMMVVENYDGSDIKVQCYSDAGTCGFNGGHMFALGLDEFEKGVDWFYDEETTTVDMQGTNQTYAEVTIGDGTKDWFITYCLQSIGANGSTRDTVSGLSDGTTDTDFFWLSSEQTSDNQTHVAFDVRENLPAATTMSVFAREEDGQITQHDVSRIFALDLGKMQQAVWDIQADPTSITQASPDNIGSLTYVAEGDQDVMLMAMTVDHCGAVSATISHEINWNIDSGANTEWRDPGTYYTGFNLNEIVQAIYPYDPITLTDGQQLNVTLDRDGESADQRATNGRTVILGFASSTERSNEAFVIGDPAYDNRVDGPLTQFSNDIEVRGASLYRGLATFNAGLEVVDSTATINTAVITNATVNDLLLSKNGDTVDFDLDGTDLVVTATGLTDARLTGFDNVVIDAGTALQSPNPLSTNIDIAQLVSVAAIPGSDEDLYYPYVQILCPFDGADASTPTPEESAAARTLTYSGCSIDTDQSRFGTASLLLDNTSDYVEIADAGSLEPGSLDWTVEGWIRPTSNDPINMDVFNKYDPTANNRAVLLGFNASSELRVILSTNGTTNTTLTSTDAPSFLANTWYHIAFVRDGNTIRVFVDGTALTLDSSTFSGSIDSNPEPWRIGTRQGSSNAFLGHIDDFRYTVGIARYTAAFTPPAAAHITDFPDEDAQWANVQFRADFDATDGDTTFADQSDNGPVTSFVGNAEIDSAQTKFGPTSLLIPNISNSYYNIADDADLQLGTNDWTIEFHGRIAGSAGSGFFYDQRTLGTQVAPTIFRSGQTLTYYNNGATRITGSSLTLNVWYHIAVCRANGTTRMFVDGVQVGSDYTDASDYISNRVRVGEAGDVTGSPLNGWVDDLRVTNGFARYPIGIDFYPPTKALPVSGTTTVAARDVVTVGDNNAETDLRGSVVLINDGAGIYTGTGTPEGVVAAPVGSLFLRTDGGTGTSIYVKEIGTGNTGWVGK